MTQDEKLVEYTSEESLLTEDLLQRKDTYILPGEELQSNTNTTLRIKSNKIAAEILKKGTVDITNPQIKIDSQNVEDLSLLESSLIGDDNSLEKLKEIRQISTGKVEVLPKNSVSLEDIDPYQIPDDQDIIIEPEKKEMVMIGRRIKESSDNLKEQRVSKRIFEELSEDEISRKYTYFFDNYSKYRSPGEKLAYFFRFLLAAIVIFTGSMTYSELQKSKYRAVLFEKQEMGQLEKLLKSKEVKAQRILNEILGVEVKEEEEKVGDIFDFDLGDLEEN